MSDDGTADYPQRNHPSRRIALWITGTLALAIVFGGGWVAASMFQSPEQRAAAQAPPPSAELTADVTSGTLAETVNAQASLERSSIQTAVIAAATGANVTVVTGTPAAAGAAVMAGQQVLEINGRPLIAVPGSFPFYRDLAEGDEGPDVRQYQDALISAGHPLRADGQFGSATVAATRALYKDLGYPPPRTVTGGTPDTGVESGSGTNASTTAAREPSAAATAESLAVPARELVVISTMPAQLEAAPSVGTVIGAETTISLSSGAMVARAQVAGTIASSITEGTPATIAGPDGIEVNGVVARIVLGEPGENAVITVAPAEGSLPEGWSGSSVLTTFTLQVVAEDSLIVPSSAVQSHGSGDAFVLKLAATGEYEMVSVEELGTLSGRSAVSPITRGELQAGDTVRIG